MTHDTNSLFRRLLRDERGVVAVLVAAAIVALVGFGSLVVDVGYYFYARSVVQASANAAALAGAQGIGTAGTPLTTATTYSAVATDKNAVGNLSITMVSGYPQLSCAATWAANSGVACSINQTPTCATASATCILASGTTGANLITVAETAKVPTFFGRIFGISSIPVSAFATASAAGSALTPYNVAIVLDTTKSMGSAPSGATALAACAGYTGSAIACAVHGAQTMLAEFWPCASGLASCSGATPVDQIAFFTFPPVTNTSQATADIGCTAPQIATTYSGVEGISEASTSTTLNLLPSSATVTGYIADAAGTAAGTVLNVTKMTSGELEIGSVITGTGVSTNPQTTITAFGTATGTTGTYTVSVSQKVSSTPGETLTAANSPYGIQLNNGTSAPTSNYMTTAYGFNTGMPWAVAKDATNAVIPSGTGSWPWWDTGTDIASITAGTSASSPGSATLSAKPTGTGVVAGDTIVVGPLYEIVGFDNNYRASDTATTLSSTSDIVEITSITKATPCLGTPGGLGTYYADAISAAQAALVAEQAANVTAKQPAGQNVIIFMSDGNASSSATQMGPLKSTTGECQAAVTAAQNAAAAGTTVYTIYYDDNGTTPTCTNPDVDTGNYTGAAPKGACYTLQQMADAPGATAGTYVNDQPKLFYSIDGTSSPCPANSSYTTIADIFQHIVSTLTNARLVPVGTI
jgi:Flp pilus assembly protein TadG